MSDAPEPSAVERRRLPRVQFRTWHLLLLVGFVAIAIANIQDQRVTEPLMVAVAAAGFVLYAVLGGLGWRLSRPLEPRIGLVGRQAVFLAGMAALFLVATLVFLAIEQVHRDGWF